MGGGRQPIYVLSVILLGALLVALTGIVVIARGAPSTSVVTTVAAGARPSALAVDERSGRVFVATVVNFNSAVCVLAADTGRVVRTTPLAGTPTALAVDARTNRVFVALQTLRVGGSVAVLDATTGALLGTVAVAAHPVALAADAQTGRVFVVDGEEDSLNILDAATGRVLGTVHIGPTTASGYNPQATAVDARSGHIFTANYSNNSVSMFDARSGRLLHTTPVVLEPAPLVVDARSNRVFVAGETAPYTPAVCVLDARTGRILRMVVGLEAEALAVDERTGRLFAVNFDGVTMLDARSGALLGSISLGGTLPQPGWSDAVSVDARSGRVFVVRPALSALGITTAPGSVAVLDGRTNRLLRTIPVGWNPGPIAVAASSGRAFVIDAGGIVPAVDPWAWVPSWLRSWLPFVPRPTATVRTVPPSISILDTRR